VTGYRRTRPNMENVRRRASWTPGTRLASSGDMAIAPATKGILLAAFLGAFSALSLATSLTRLSPPEPVAPEGRSARKGAGAEPVASPFSQELKQRPRDPVLYFRAGSAEYAMGRTGSALSSLQRAVELDPQFAEALMMLGQVAYERGDSGLAIRSMEKASALRPRDGGLTALLDRWRRESSLHTGYIERSAEHFRILYEGGAQQRIGDRVARVLEREYWHIGKTLNSFPTETLTVILYTNREFQDITRSPSWATGAYDGRIRIAVGGTLPSGDLDRIVTHELVHAVVASAAPRRVPAWLNEGLATYLEGSDNAWARDVLGKATAIVPLDTLVHGFSGLDEQGALVAYAESAIAAEILCEKLGLNIGSFLQIVGDGDSIDQALLTFQVQPNAFHSEWRRRVGLQ
jgi:tetratricopeptide (TPR) repeat protein